MQHKPALQKQLMQKASLGLLAGLLLWIGTLMYASTQLRSHSSLSRYNASIGPLVLNEIHKHQMDQGFRATITFESGIIWFLVLSTATGAAVGLITYRK